MKLYNRLKKKRQTASTPLCWGVSQLSYGRYYQNFSSAFRKRRETALAENLLRYWLSKNFCETVSGKRNEGIGKVLQSQSFPWFGRREFQGYFNGKHRNKTPGHLGPPFVLCRARWGIGSRLRHFAWSWFHADLWYSNQSEAKGYSYQKECTENGTKSKNCIDHIRKQIIHATRQRPSIDSRSAWPCRKSERGTARLPKNHSRASGQSPDRRYRLHCDKLASLHVCHLWKAFILILPF